MFDVPTAYTSATYHMCVLSIWSSLMFTAGTDIDVVVGPINSQAKPIAYAKNLGPL